MGSQMPGFEPSDTAARALRANPQPVSTVASAAASIAVRRDSGLWGYERALQGRGFGAVAGVDEAGRGACAGPLVVAAVVLPQGRRGRIPGLADSKLLSAAARAACYTEVLERASAWSAVVVPAGEVDRRGIHVVNIEGMRRAVARLGVQPSYVLTDGFPVPGLGPGALAVWKGDRVAACVAAASVVAKVTRDRLMDALHERFPDYDFGQHKGYTTPQHSAALTRHGPCPEHRRSYINVATAAAGSAGLPEGWRASVISLRSADGQNDGMPATVRQSESA